MRRKIINKIIYSIMNFGIATHKVRKTYQRTYEDVINELDKKGYSYAYPFNQKISFMFEAGCTLSLLIPVYNDEKYLKKCLDSLINQETDINYEIVCVDDGSVDSSLEILKEYSKKYPIIRFEHQENKGISATRNRCLELSKGEYVGFIDNDDYVSEKYIQELICAAIVNKSDIVKCGHYEIRNNQRYLSSFMDYVTNDGINNIITELNGFIWGGIYSRQLWKDICFPEGFWYEDMITRLLLYSRCRNFTNIHSGLYYKRDHEHNASRVVWKKDIKKLDQIFLVLATLRKLRDLKIRIDSGLYEAILYEMVDMTCSRVSVEYLEYAFAVTVEIYFKYLRDLDKHALRITKFQNDVIKSIEFKDYCLYKMLMIQKKTGLI